MLKKVLKLSYQEILELNIDDLNNLVAEHLMDGKIELYSKDIRHAWTIIEERKNNGVHITVQPHVQGYRIYWYDYEEVYCDQAPEGICRVSLLSLLD